MPETEMETKRIFPIINHIITLHFGVLYAGPGEMRLPCPMDGW